MDGIKVTALDRLRNRLKLWVRERFYELPTAHHLKQGLDPAMVRTLNNFFSGRDLGMYLPYEIFTDEGLFKNEESLSFGLGISNAGRIGFPVALNLQQDLLQEIPEGWFVQFQAFSLSQWDGYRCVMTVTGEQSDVVRRQLVEVRARLQAVLQRHGLTFDLIDPVTLLTLMSSLLDAEIVPTYDDERLVKTQVGISQVRVRNGRLMLSQGDTPIRDLAIYQARRFGRIEPTWIRHLYDDLVGRVEFYFSLNIRRVGTGIEGQFLVMEPMAHGDAGKLEAALLQHEWLVEADRYCTHLSWLSLMPFGVGPMVFGALDVQRRWNPISWERLGKILPLPYSANLAIAEPMGEVVNG